MEQDQRFTAALDLMSKFHAKNFTSTALVRPYDLKIQVFATVNTASANRR